MEILDDIFERLAVLLGVEVYFNFAVSADGSHLRLAAAHGISPGQREGLRRLEFGQAICGAVAASREAIAVTDVQHSVDPRTEIIRSLGITAYASWPLIANGRLLGTLSYGTRTSARFSPEALMLLQTVCNYVASHPLPAVHSSSDGKSKGPENGSDPFQDIVQLGTRLMRARYGALALLKEGEETVARFCTAGFDGEDGLAIGAFPSDGLLGAIIRDPRPMRVKDISGETWSAGLPAHQTSARSFVGVPLVSRKKVHGCLYFAGREDASEFRRTDERLAEILAHVAIKAVESEWVYAEVLEALSSFRRALEDTNGAAVIVGPTREIIFWSNGAEELFGYSEDEALGRSFVDLLVPPEDRPRWKRSWESRLGGLAVERKSIQSKVARLRKSGERISVLASITPFQHDVAGITAHTRVYIFQKA